MALRLGDLVEFGELINTKRNSVHGWFKLRGSGDPVMFELTGDCAPDLRGKHVRFTAGPPPTGLRKEQEGAFDLRAVRRQQVGPTGLMTAGLRAQVAPCTRIQFQNMSRCGEPPPLQLKRLFYLEWFSQNGRVVVELVDPVLEVAITGSHGEEALYIPLALPGWNSMPIHKVEQGSEPLCIPVDPDSDTAPVSIFQRIDNPDDPLSTGDLWGEGEDENSSSRTEAELLDCLLGSESEGETVETLLAPLGPLPDPATLNEQEAEGVVKALLAQLALCGVALHFCEHYTYIDALHLLEREIIRERTFARQMSASSFVQHYLTAEHCQACIRQLEEREIPW